MGVVVCSTRRTARFYKQPSNAAETDERKVEMPNGEQQQNTAPKPNPAPRWQKLHKILMGAKYSSNYSSNETAYWNEKDKKWEIKGGINCITSVNFFLGYMLKKGGNGYKPAVGANLVTASQDKNGFSDHFKQLQLAFKPHQGEVTLKKLRNSGSRYKGVDRFPYWEMPFGTTKRAVCKCGLHVSPKYVIENKDKLARVNVASVSLVSGKPVGTMTRWWRDKETSRPFSDTDLYWEYTVMLIFKINNELYTYHHSRKVSERWRKFITQAQAYVVDTGSKVQDSLWLIWKLPDEVWQQINPDFFKDDKGNEWHPPLP